MSKQLSLSAILAISSMAFVALAATLVDAGASHTEPSVASAPLVSFEASR